MEDSDCDMEPSSDAHDEEDEEDDYHEFEAPPPAATQSSFRCVHALDLAELHARDVKWVAERLCAAPAEAAILLRAHKWDKERVIGSYFENPEGVLEKAGVCDPSKVCVVDHQAREPFVCPVCLESVAVYAALGCGHMACTDCYRTYVSLKIEDEGNGSIRARCLQPKCGVLLTETFVKSLVAEPLQAKFAMYLERSYVDDNPKFAWCPSPECTNAIYMAHIPDTAPPSGALRVRCECGTNFCFACRHDDHSPATCEQLKMWLVKCKDDSETYNWLQANTRLCPVCKTAIEKNGGCNHMTCKKCAHEWCWVCSGPWKDHSGHFYTCNRYKEGDDEDSKRKKDQSKAALERYLHYYTRYINHHNSLKFEESTRTQMEQKIEEMQNLGNNTWLDVQYLKEATETLLSCRHALQYTYVYAFYLSPTNHKDLFEQSQRDLEVTTEDLSAEMEKAAEDIVKIKVIESEQMCKKRLSNLFSAVEAHRVEHIHAGDSASHASG